MAHAPSCVLVDATTGTTAGVHDDQDDCGGGCDQKHGHDQPAGATPRSKSEPFFLPSVEYGHGITSFPALPRFASTNGSGSSAAPASAGLTGDDAESHLAVRLRALEARISASPAVADAVLSLSAPDEPTLVV